MCSCGDRELWWIGLLLFWRRLWLDSVLDESMTILIVDRPLTFSLVAISTGLGSMGT
jgi:hypothetical protein